MSTSKLIAQSQKKRWNLFLKIPFILFLVASILDLSFTTRNYLVLNIFTEINPLYKILNNYWIFLIINIILTVTILILYVKTFNKPGNTLMMKYVMYTVLLIGGVMRLYGFWSNLKWILNPVTDPVALQALQTKVLEQGTAIYSGLVFQWIIYPFILVYLLFWLFQKAVRLKEE